MMLVPAWDFGRDDWPHSRMSMLRGVEGGFTIARAARGGLLTVSDRYGRILGQRQSSTTPYAAIVVNAALGAGRETPYARFGDVFGWTALAFGLIASLWAALRRKAD
jgi:apolipoprotein N-acyltransferase